MASCAFHGIFTNFGRLLFSVLTKDSRHSVFFYSFLEVVANPQCRLYGLCCLQGKSGIWTELQSSTRELACPNPCLHLKQRLKLYKYDKPSTCCAAPVDGYPCRQGCFSSAAPCAPLAASAVEWEQVACVSLLPSSSKCPGTTGSSSRTIIMATALLRGV